MLRISRPLHATRTAGYVFWRQRNLIELEKSKRSYLLNERPYPVAEISRRMVLVRSKFSATSDFHEQTLLRGEYKYFTGKLLDLRKASLNDMIAYVEMGSVFGFWDTAQIDCVLDELMLHLLNLSSNQAIHLLVAISGVRKHQSNLYQAVAASLLPLVEDMAFEDAILLTKACEMEDPPPLLEALFARIASDLERVDAQAAVTVLCAMTCVSKSVQLHYEAMVQELKNIVVDTLQQQSLPHSEGASTALTLVEIASVSEALVTLETFDRTTRECMMRAFLLRLKDACPRSLAMMLYACDSSDFTRAAESRVLHHLMRFSTSELYAVTKVHTSALATVSQLVRRKQHSKVTSSTVVNAATSDTTLIAANPMMTSLSTSQPSTSSLIDDLEDDMMPPILATAEERAAAESQQRDLARVVLELMQQVLLHVQSSTAHAEPAVYLGLLRCTADVQTLSHLLGGSFLFRQTVHAICAKLVSVSREMDVEELVEFLVLANRLGQLALHAAIVSIMDMLRTRISLSRAVASPSPSSSSPEDDAMYVVTSADAAVLFNTLHELSGLNVLQRRKLDADILPLLRRRVGEDDATLLRF